MRSVPLIERRAEARMLAEAIADHRNGCAKCNAARSRVACPELIEMRASLKAMRDEIAYWFDPGPDQPTLL